ncbi:MAG: RHS repeat-associated core domain-containing protein, partial [Pseudomonadota bacterium]
PTEHGYTGHEELSHVGIIHMKGRIYDPNVGRFMQADPFIQAPTNTQNHNRYSYVLNNPMSYTDPSGYFRKAIGNVFKKVFRAIAKVPILNTIAQGVACFYGGPWGCAAYASASTYSVTGSLGAAFRSGAIAFASAKAFQRIGDQFKYVSGVNEAAITHGATGFNQFYNFGGLTLTSGQIAAQIGYHAATGGVIAELSGSQFGHGFLSAGITKGVGGGFLPAGNNLSTSEIATGTIVSSVIGGTTSVISGGKFANGANTAAFQYLYNQVEKRVRRSVAVRTALHNLKSTYKAALQVGSPAIGPSVRVGTYVYKDGDLYIADKRVNSNGGRFLELNSNAFGGAQSLANGVSDWFITTNSSLGMPNFRRLEARWGGNFSVQSVYSWNTETNAVHHHSRTSSSSNDWSCQIYGTTTSC